MPLSPTKTKILQLLTYYCSHVYCAQLLHVKSSKFITVIPDKLASHERENMVVTLSDRGSVFSWLQVLPRYKIDREGDRILSGTEVILRVCERPNEFIHCSDRQPRPGLQREVNCSLEQSAWKVSSFQTVKEASDTSLLLTAQLVAIHDPETRSNIQVVLDPDAGDHRVAIQPAVGAPGDFDSTSLWVIESKNLIDGGTIQWKSDHIRFRNLNTGMYLAVRTTNSKKTGKELAELHVSNTATPSTLFTLHEMYSSTFFLSNGKAMQICHNNTYVERGEYDDESGTYHASLSKEKARAVSLLIHRYVQTWKRDQVDVGELVTEKYSYRSRIEEPLDVYVGVAAKKYLSKYLEGMVVPTTDFSAGTLWPEADRSTFYEVVSVLKKINLFVRGYRVSDDQEQQLLAGIVPVINSTFRRARQTLALEQGVVKQALTMLDMLRPLAVRTEGMNFQSKVFHSKSDQEKSIIRICDILVTQLFNLLYYCLEGNSRVQIDVADSMPVLLAYVATQSVASKCVTEMLSTNMELQETKIGAREINIFIGKLRESKMNCMYLNLLKACCSCMGRAIDGNQGTIAEELFADISDIIIQIHPDTSKLQKVEWDESGRHLFIPDNPEPGSPMLGQDLLTKGIPALSLSWTTKSIDYSPLGLFGRLSVSIMDLYPGKSSSATAESKEWRRSQGKSSAAQMQKQAVADYFIAELFLAAEMCLGRNYVAMQKLEHVFPYEVLVTIMKVNVSEALKAAATRLVLCLYVDREPQIVTTVPCLTRAWSEIAKSGSPQLPNVDVARKNHFSLLQQLISEHVLDMQGRRWEELSVSIMLLLKHLIMFNFYGSKEKLKDVIEPLIRAIDRRQVSVDEDIDGILRKMGAGVSSKRKKLKRQRTDGDRSLSLKQINIESSHTYGDLLEEGKESDGNNNSPTQLVLDNSEGPQDDCGTWQERVLRFLESLPVMGAVVCLVFVAIVVAIIQVASGSKAYGYYVFDLAVTFVFCFEVSLRFYCYMHTRNEVMSFFTNVLNDIDILVVCIDLVILSIPNAGGNGTQFFKALRAARLVRLVRVLRAAHIVQKLKDLSVKSYDAWKMPVRYLKTPQHELDTMVEAVNILSYVQQIIEDRNLSLLLQGFRAWQAGTDTRSPGEIFESVILDSKDLSLKCDIFDDVFIDTLMFNHVDLVQVVLDVLMAHHSARFLLFNNAQKTQLLIAPQRERQLKTIRNMLRELERNAETHELWGELQTEEDQRLNRQTFEHMNDLIQMCRTRCKVLEFDEDYKADSDIQNLLRNLGFFPIALKILGLIPSLNNDEDGDEGEISINTRNMIRTCNHLLYWFLNNNADNQALAFDELEFFLSCIDMRIDAHRVIHAMFKNNETLMKSCPRPLIEHYSERVCKLGRQPQFLAILSSVTHVRDRNILDNQYEIVKHLMAPGRTKKMTRFCGGKDDPEYEVRAEMMRPFIGKGDVTIEELPTELGYHLEFLRVLSGCTVGRINITTVEAKVQSVYELNGLLEAMMDDRTISLAKTRLGLLFYNAMIEVEINVGGLGTAPKMWEFIVHTKTIFKKAVVQLRTIEEKGWELSKVPRQDIEYTVVCSMILAGFFLKYFDLTNFESFQRDDKPTMTIDEVQEIILSVFTQLYVIYDMKCTCLSQQQKAFIANALDSMQRYSPKLTSLYPSIDGKDNPMEAMEENDDGDEVDHSKGRVIEMVPASEEEAIDVMISRKFEDFIKLLQSDDEVRSSISRENRDFVEYIDHLPFVKDNVESDVRYEALIKKLVKHVRDRLETVGNEKRLDARCTQTTTWVIRSFRTMIESKWGMSIYERDDAGGEEEDIAAAPIVHALNSCGATTLCLDLICVGIDPGLMLESVKLCVAMLFLEGGNLPVQQTMFNYLSNIKSDLFFRQVRQSLQNLINWHKWHDVIIIGEDDDVNLEEEIIIVRFLQLMCEGHYLPNQNIMREQPNNTVSVNLLDDFVQYLNCLSRIPCRTSTDAATRISATILEVIQGPCELNQEHFALQTELIETLNRIIRSKTIRDCCEEEEVDLKKTAIDILQGLLEGQGGKNGVYDRVLSVVHLDAIHMMSQPEERRRVNPDDSEEEEEKEESEEVVVLRVECLVLLQMLCDYRPALREEIDISSDNIAVKGVSVACVEILWNGELQRRFFHVPKICSDLAKASKDALVENVDRSNQENKLLDFLLRSRELYREIKHQQVLKEYRVSGIFSRSNQDKATWLSLVIACVINAILIAYYKLEDGEPTLAPTISVVVDALNIFQIAFSSFTLILFLVVRVPVKYQSNQAAGMSQFRSVLYTCSDPMTLYYVFYLAMSIFGYNISYFFLTILLLDILVKNSTARDILMAVVYPRKQLAMTYVLTVFVVYIFAFIIVSYIPVLPVIVLVIPNVSS